MRKTLHFPLPYAVEFEGKTYSIKPYFDNVLKVYALQKESDLTDADRVDLSLELLIEGKVDKLAMQQKIGLLNVAYDTLMGDAGSSKKAGAPAFDFVQDAGYIYASFFMDYGLDLYEQQGRLHWWKFYHLFLGLSDKAKIVQIMQIRSKEIPAPTKHNAEERAQLVRLKAQYALEFTQEERERNFAAGLKRLGEVMQNMV